MGSLLIWSCSILNPTHPHPHPPRTTTTTTTNNNNKQQTVLSNSHVVDLSWAGDRGDGGSTSGGERRPSGNSGIGWISIKDC